MIRSGRWVIAAVAAATLMGAAATPAYAWPIPLTPDQTSFLNTARGTGFPGDGTAPVRLQIAPGRRGDAGVSAVGTALAGQSAQPGGAESALLLRRKRICLPCAQPGAHVNPLIMKYVVLQTN
jgi:hypothetical protein